MYIGKLGTTIVDSSIQFAVNFMFQSLIVKAYLSQYGKFHLFNLRVGDSNFLTFFEQTLI